MIYPCNYVSSVGAILLTKVSVLSKCTDTRPVGEVIELWSEPIRAPVPSLILCHYVVRSVVARQRRSQTLLAILVWKNAENHHRTTALVIHLQNMTCSPLTSFFFLVVREPERIRRVNAFLLLSKRSSMLSSTTDTDLERKHATKSMPGLRFARTNNYGFWLSSIWGRRPEKCVIH